jgi:hypothetical protein
MSVFPTYTSVIDFCEKAREVKIRSFKISPCGEQLELVHSCGAIIYQAQGFPSLVKVAFEEVEIIKNRQ